MGIPKYKKKDKTWFEAKDAAKYSELTMDMVNYLCRHELVVPTAGTKRGRGTKRRFSFTDILLLRVLSKLLAKGISPLRIKDNLEAMNKRGIDTKGILTTRYVVTDGYDIYFQDDGVIELLDSGQMAFAFILELSKLREEISANIMKELKIA